MDVFDSWLHEVQTKFSSLSSSAVQNEQMRTPQKRWLCANVTREGLFICSNVQCFKNWLSYGFPSIIAHVSKVTTLLNVDRFKKYCFPIRSYVMNVRYWHSCLILSDTAICWRSNLRKKKNQFLFPSETYVRCTNFLFHLFIAQFHACTVQSRISNSNVTW